MTLLQALLIGCGIGTSIALFVLTFMMFEFLSDLRQIHREWKERK